MFNYSRRSEAGRLGSAGSALFKLGLKSIRCSKTLKPHFQSDILFLICLLNAVGKAKIASFDFPSAQDGSKRAEPALHSVGLLSAVRRIFT